MNPCRDSHHPGCAVRDVEWPRVGGFPSGQQAQARLRGTAPGVGYPARSGPPYSGKPPRNNGTLFGRPRKVDDTEHIATAKRMKADGHTAKDIAKYLGVSRATLYRYLAEDNAALIRWMPTRTGGRQDWARLFDSA